MSKLNNIIWAKTRAGFDSAENPIKTDSIAFIEDTSEIWAKGHYYPCPYSATEITNLLNNKVDKESGKSLVADELITKLTGLNDQNTIDAAIDSVKNTIDNYTINGHKINENPTLTKNDVGLGNVTNEAQIPLSQKGAVNGVATLTENGKVPASQLPAYVDDVLEGTLASTTEFTLNEGQQGEVKQSGVVYIDTTTNKSYRWSGSQYVMTGSDLALGETSSTAYAGDKGKQVTDRVAEVYGANSTINGLSDITFDSDDSVGQTLSADNALKTWDGSGTSHDIKIPYATTSKAGVMSADDKTKLNSIESGANKTIIDSELSNTSTNPLQNKVIKAALDKWDDAFVSVENGTITSTTINNSGTQVQNVSATFTLYDKDTDDSLVTMSGNIGFDTATEDMSGLMSADDKLKLNSLEIGGLPTIGTDAIDLDFGTGDSFDIYTYLEYSTGQRPLAYKVKHSSMDYCVGVLDLIPDSMGCVLIERLTTSATASGGETMGMGGWNLPVGGDVDFNQHSDGHVCTMFRVFNFNAHTLDESKYPKYQWSKWTSQAYHELSPLLPTTANRQVLAELSRPSAGTIAMKKLRTQYLAFATDGTNEIGGLFIDDTHTMIQAKQGTPIKLGWRGGAAGFGMNLNGQVGLGYTTDGSLPTIDPTARLTVDGDLRVLGKVVADTPTPATATKIENGTDLNTLTEPGWYYFDGTSTDKETLVHTPPSLGLPKFLMLVTPSSRPGTTYENGFKCSIILPFHILTTSIIKLFYFRRSMTGKWTKVDLSSIATTEEWET